MLSLPLNPTRGMPPAIYKTLDRGAWRTSEQQLFQGLLWGRERPCRGSMETIQREKPQANFKKVGCAQGPARI